MKAPDNILYTYLLPKCGHLLRKYLFENRENTPPNNTIFYRHIFYHGKVMKNRTKSIRISQYSSLYSKNEVLTSTHVSHCASFFSLDFCGFLSLSYTPYEDKVRLIFRSRKEAIF